MARDIGTSSVILLSASGSAAAYGATAVVVKTDTAGVFRTLIFDGSSNEYLEITNANKPRYVHSGGSATADSLTVQPADGWVLLVARKGPGTVAPIFSKYVFSSATWTHETAPETMGDASGTRGTMQFGSMAGQLAMLARFDTVELSESDVESLASSLAAWIDLGPTALWVLDQTTTSHKVADWIGGVHQTAIVGTSVVAGPGELEYGRLFASQTPSGANNNDGAPGITTATSFQVAEVGDALAARFFATTTVGGTYTVGLWQVTNDDDPGPGAGTLLASKTLAGAPSPGTWNTVVFDSPVAVTPGVLYRVGVHNTAGRYVNTTSFAPFVSGGLTNGDVTAPADGADPVSLGTLRQGTYHVGGSLTYPPSYFSDSCYFVDIAFIPGAGGGPVTHEAAAALSVTATLAAVGASTKPAAAALAVTATLATAATASKPAAAARTVTATLAAGATLTRTAAAALSANATLATAATATKPATASLSVTATLAASTGASAVSADAALTATATLTTIASASRPAAAALSITATLAATATPARVATAGLAVTATLSTTATASRPTTAALAATATLASEAVTGAPPVVASAALAATATLTTAAMRTAVAAAALTAAATLAAGPTRVQLAQAALAVTAALSTTAPISRQVSAALAVTATLIASANAVGNITYRPFAGNTSRPYAGITLRP